jgi:hypothetical protein
VVEEFTTVAMPLEGLFELSCFYETREDFKKKGRNDRAVQPYPCCARMGLELNRAV